MSLGVSRVRDRIALLSMLTVRVVVLEYNQLLKKDVLRDADIRANGSCTRHHRTHGPRVRVYDKRSTHALINHAGICTR